MKSSVWIALAASLCGLSSEASGADAVEAFETSPAEPAGADRLPKGKEADGILGDFVLRNAHVEALISANLPGRKANMTTNGAIETPGLLYDLCVRGSANDQLTAFAPGGLQGPVSQVFIRRDHGILPEVVAERTCARVNGHGESHRYLLTEGDRYLTIISLYENGAATEWKIKPEPVVKGLSNVKSFQGIFFGDAMNPPDHQGYAWALIPVSGSEASWNEADLKPGEKKTYTAAAAPGRSPAEAFGIVARIRGATGNLKARFHQKDAGIETATLSLWLDEATILPAYPDPKGQIEISLPPGSYRYAASDRGRPTIEGKVDVPARGAADLDFEMKAASVIAFDIADAAVEGKNCPVKVQFIGLGLTPNPDLGTDIQAHGSRNQYFSESGWFRVAVPPGSYRILVTHGIEFSHLERDVAVEPGKTARVAGSLRRIVDTAGYISADFHSHSTPSGDNYCGTDDRIINHAAEQIELAPATEHNRFYDWGPHIQKLGLSSEIATAVGIELTGPLAHFNAFPFKVTQWVQDNGAPTWQRDPRINAIVLRDFQEGGPDRYVQINHPNVGQFFRDRNADGIADGGFPGLEHLIDAAEVWSEEILNPSPWLLYVDKKTGKETIYQNRTFAWLQLLNQGRYLYAVAVSDAHSIFENGVGGWRTYLPSSTDEPAKIDLKEIVRNARAGRMVVTNGPFLEARLTDGTPPGGHTIQSGAVEIDVKVQATDWVDVDRVQVLVNGRQAPELNFTRKKNPELFLSGVVKFQSRIKVPLSEDACLIVAAVGESSTLKTGYGDAWQGAMHPVAFTNPIFVDTDGNGFHANGDTLGQPLPQGKPPEKLPAGK